MFDARDTALRGLGAGGPQLLNRGSDLATSSELRQRKRAIRSLEQGTRSIDVHQVQLHCARRKCAEVDHGEPVCMRVMERVVTLTERARDTLQCGPLTPHERSRRLTHRVRGLLTTPRMASYTRQARLRSAWGVARQISQILNRAPATQRSKTASQPAGAMPSGPLVVLRDRVTPVVSAASAAPAASTASH